MKIIYLEDNAEILVDDEDYSFVMLCYNLEVDKNGYPICKLKDKFKRKKMGFYSSISLHKLLVLPEETGRSINVDHRDGNKLNNQKSNLRICTHEENMWNRKVQSKYANKQVSSQYKGVHWDAKLNLWQSTIRNIRYFGIFNNEIAAANCYNYWAKHYFGEFARLNDCPFMPKEEWETYIASKPKTSKYRGVSLANGKYKAQIWDGKRNIQLGDFENEDEAARAYNAKAIELKGEKARLNIIN